MEILLLVFGFHLSFADITTKTDKPEIWDIRFNIPGEPNVDYPIYTSVPETSFTCEGRYEGYYADMETRCQVFRVCAQTDLTKKGFGFLCPNGTLFNQKYFVCDWHNHVDCEKSINYYFMNKNGENVVTNTNDMLDAINGIINYPKKQVTRMLQNIDVRNRSSEIKHRDESYIVRNISKINLEDKEKLNTKQGKTIPKPIYSAKKITEFTKASRTYINTILSSNAFKLNDIGSHGFLPKDHFNSSIDHHKRIPKSIEEVRASLPAEINMLLKVSDTRFLAEERSSYGEKISPRIKINTNYIFNDYENGTNKTSNQDKNNTILKINPTLAKYINEGFSTYNPKSMQSFSWDQHSIQKVNKANETKKFKPVKLQNNIAEKIMVNKPHGFIFLQNNQKLLDKTKISDKINGIHSEEVNATRLLLKGLHLTKFLELYNNSNEKIQKTGYVSQNETKETLPKSINQSLWFNNISNGMVEALPLVYENDTFSSTQNISRNRSQYFKYRRTPLIINSAFMRNNMNNTLSNRIDIPYVNITRPYNSTQIINSRLSKTPYALINNRRRHQRYKLKNSTRKSFIKISSSTMTSAEVFTSSVGAKRDYIRSDLYTERVKPIYVRPSHHYTSPKSIQVNI